MTYVIDLCKDMLPFTRRMIAWDLPGPHFCLAKWPHSFVLKTCLVKYCFGQSLSEDGTETKLTPQRLLRNSCLCFVECIIRHPFFKREPTKAFVPLQIDCLHNMYYAFFVRIIILASYTQIFATYDLEQGKWTTRINQFAGMITAVQQIEQKSLAALFASCLSVLLQGWWTYHKPYSNDQGKYGTVILRKPKQSDCSPIGWTNHKGCKRHCHIWVTILGKRQQQHLVWNKSLHLVRDTMQTTISNL